MKEKYVKASYPNEACYIVMDDSLHGSDRPIMVFGAIRVQGTDDRDSPPDPISGFPCARTPFAKGHLMALELGGPDISENIVPQYQYWQGIGTWRKMETSLSGSLKGTTDSIFVVFVTYGNSDNKFTQQFNRLSDQEIFDWADYRIPTSFDIWVFATGSKIGGEIESEILDSSAKNRLNDALKLKSSIGGTKVYQTLDHSKMPTEDRIYWQSQHIFEAIEIEHESYNKDRSEDWESGGKSPIRESTYEFLKKNENFSSVKDRLENDYDWPKSETVSLSFDRALASTIGKVLKRDIKNWDQKLQKRELERKNGVTKSDKMNKKLKK